MYQFGRRLASFLLPGALTLHGFLVPDGAVQGAFVLQAPGFA
jgi:hypothetical protein